MNKIALITGSSDGVGKEVAKRLAIQGVHVVLHGRNRVKTEQVKDEISVDATGLVDMLIADLSSLHKVRELAQHIVDTYSGLDILINNAGIGIADGTRQESEDGYELRFAVNYLSHFLLTRAPAKTSCFSYGDMILFWV